jgi:leucyl aminopeptidase
MVECLVEGLILGAYSFRKYKHRDKNDPDAPGELQGVELYGKNQTAIKQGAQRGEVAARAACEARNMANEPGNFWTPTHFADHAEQLAKRYGFGCRILGKPELKRLGMGGILGVNQGSEQPPRLVIVEHHPKGGKKPTLLLVGKGLTFDAGGLSLKPSAGMEEMKYDMCGGAAVLAVMQAVGEEKPKNLNIIAMVPATENLPGPAALKPGDLITQYGGKTVEVVNTDAEGRLIVADALAYGVKKYQPDFVVDIATLTGAVVIGLGHHRTGLLTNHDDLCQKLIAAGERSGEPLWRLPLGAEYRKQLDSQVADLKNVGNRDGGTSTAATFLQEFVGETPWAHLDIAGTAWNYTEKSYVPKGPSAVGVRTLLELIRSWGK